MMEEVIDGDDEGYMPKSKDGDQRLKTENRGWRGKTRTEVCDAPVLKVLFGKLRFRRYCLVASLLRLQRQAKSAVSYGSHFTQVITVRFQNTFHLESYLQRCIVLFVTSLLICTLMVYFYSLQHKTSLKDSKDDEEGSHGRNLVLGWEPAIVSHTSPELHKL